MPAIRVSADRVNGGEVVQSTYGEIVVSAVAGRVVIVADANWKCDQFSAGYDDAVALADAIRAAAEEAWQQVKDAEDALLQARPALGTTTPEN